MISVANSLHFAFQAPVALFPSEVRNLSPELPVRGLRVETFPSSRLPGVVVPSHIHCIFFYLYLLPCLILRRLALPFGSLGLQGSEGACVGAVPHEDEFLMYL